MSGNPFRRPAQASTRADESAIDNLHVEVPKSPPKTKNGKPKKRVTIISPPQSPVDVPERPRRLSDGKTGSPPPPPVTVTPEDVAATNATSTADPDLQRALLNTQRNSDGAEPLPPPGPTGMMRAPYNPFARTLATSDAQLGLQRAATEERGNEKPAGGPPKMNVDMFKNLLMTGSASPSPPVTQHTQPQQPQDSSTDTSSVSRQSLFDPTHELHPESPRTSFDQQSISDEDEEEDNEHVSLMGPTTSRPEPEGPPPPPKHRHGKALGPKGPQTVSFADFNESIPAGWQQPPGVRTPPVNSPLQGILRPSTPRSPSSDLNKPLPNKPLPPPPEAQAAPETPTPTMANDHPATLPFVPQPEAPLPKKAPPPPPPTSRRQAQGQNRSRSGSNLTQNSIQEEDETPKPTTKAVPPPPPSRRAHNPPAVQPAPAVETPPITEPSSPVSENKPMPPPPRRNPSKSGSSHIRSSSNASSHSIPRQEGGAPPPAPPPRRGAGTARSSMSEHGYRRSSVQSVGSDASSLRQIDDGAQAEASPKQPERDIMADLAALQAEVDALRAGAGNGLIHFSRQSLGEDPELFQAYLNCVYFGSEALEQFADASEAEAEAKPEGRTRHEQQSAADVAFEKLIGLFLLAEDTADFKTANMAVTEIIRASGLLGCIPTQGPISLAYDSTSNNNPSRTLLRDFWVHEKTKIRTDSELLRTAGFPAEFVQDIAMELLRITSEKDYDLDKSVEDIIFEDMCRYHQHDELHPACVSKE